MPTKTVTGTIEEVTVKDNYTEVSIRQSGPGNDNGRRYPEKYKAWHNVNPNLGSIAQDGAGGVWTLTLEESPNLNSRGNPYWNLLVDPPADDDLPFQEYQQNRPEKPVQHNFDQPAPAALGMCQNNAVDRLRYGFISMPDGDDLTTFLWEWRDKLYSEVASKPYLGEHGCYVHGMPRVQGKSGKWGHRDGNGWCMDDGSDPLPELPDTEDEEQEVLDF